MTYDSEQLKARFEAAVAADPDLEGRVGVVDFTCFGRCDEGPNCLVREAGEGEDLHREPGFRQLTGIEGLYVELDADRVDRVIKAHLKGGKALRDLVQTY